MYNLHIVINTKTCNKFVINTNINLPSNILTNESKNIIDTWLKNHININIVDTYSVSISNAKKISLT